MSSVNSFWSRICIRLGVNSKQFGVLLSICVMALGIVGTKVVIGGPSKAAAKSAVALSTIAAVTPPPSPSALKAVAFTLQTWPSRDPFRGSSNQGNSPDPGALGKAPASLRLGATMDGQFAVINGKTLKEGQSLTDPVSGSSYRLLEVETRSVTMEAGGQRFQIAFD
ncbi:MAG: hypothetical protein EXS00_00200 [Phycisphaerales bacterium]|nr:hypothetical protein [Phycisphaerales bacterium]